MTVPAHALEAQRLAEQLRGQGDQPEPMFDVDPRPAVGGACAGYGGLEKAVLAAMGGRVVWVAEYDDAPSRVLAHHDPDVPNLRDVTAINWAQCQPVEVLAAGYPCQPFSLAGRRSGEDDPRHLWPYIAEGIRIMRPRVFVGENVRGHLSLGFDQVLADLRELGYDVRWTLLRAADVGAPHGRARLFFVATDRRQHRQATAEGELLALWDEEDGWVESDAGLFGAIPFAGKLPAAGAMVRGELYAAAPEAVPASSPALLPTPEAKLAHSGPDYARMAREGSGGHDLTTAVWLLPTPTATPYGNNQSPSDGAAVRPSLDSLASSGALLPTPTARDHKGAGYGDAPGRPLSEAVLALLPTPIASDAEGGARTLPEARTHGGKDFGPRLRDLAPTLLPTPRATDGTKGGPGQTSTQGGPSLPAVAGALLPTPTATDACGGRNATAGRSDPDSAHHSGTTLSDVAYTDTWGAYGPAIHRWEAILGRPAPAPTMAGVRGGQQLSPAFVEFMMGLPEGHVTAVPGLTRAEQLKMLGNGVVVQQGAAAIRWLLAQAGIDVAAAEDVVA